MSNDANASGPVEAGQGIFKNILVPVDFSPRAQKALAFGAALARQFGARLTALHVVEIPFVGSGVGEMELILPLETNLRGTATEQLARLVLEQVTGQVVTDTVVRTGQPWFEIADAARQMRADLIVVGTHGYTGLKHVLLGSTAERVVRHASCPVLVVREEELDFVKPPPDTAESSKATGDQPMAG